MNMSRHLSIHLQIYFKHMELKIVLYYSYLYHMLSHYFNSGSFKIFEIFIEYIKNISQSERS
jgi:hypothetical protein